MMTSKRSVIWMGRGMSTLVTLALLADAAVEFFAPMVVAPEAVATGFSTAQAPVLGTIMLVCAVVYAIPRTAIFGAVLITGFLGGAICTHFRIGEGVSAPVFVSLMLAAFTWGGLYLRDSRLRDLLPYCTDAS